VPRNALSKVWPTSTIGNLIANGKGEVKTGPFGTKLKASEYTETGVPVISVGEVGFGRFTLRSETPKVDESVTSRMPEYLLRTGDIVFGRKGAVERSSIVRKDEDGWFLGSDGIRLRLPSDVFSPFIAYQLQTEAHKTWMIQHAAGTTMPSLNQGTIERIPVVLPPISVQKSIARILGTLDDKIELNRRINQTLEEMAQALFKSWFVDFDPVKAKASVLEAGGTPQQAEQAAMQSISGKSSEELESFKAARPEAYAELAHTASLFPSRLTESELGQIPEGWETGSILQIASLLSGGTPKTSEPSYWDGDVAWASAKDVSQCSDAFLVNTERTITQVGLEKSTTKLIPAFATAIVARGATTGRMTIFGREMAMNQTCYALQSKIGTPFSLYCHARQFMDEMVHSAHGAIFDTITTSTFATTMVVLPGSDLLKAFNEAASPLFAGMLTRILETESIQTSRDSLLPKLLSGELEIPDELLAEVSA
jgi:type I restriction enzyme S subunit